MMKALSIVAAAALMTATGALAQDSEAEAPKAEKKICKSEKVTGSLTKVRRTCLTQAQWDELTAAARKGVSDMVRNSQNQSGPASGSAN